METSQGVLNRAFNEPLRTAFLKSLEETLRHTQLDPGHIVIKSTLLGIGGYREELVLKYLSESPDASEAHDRSVADKPSPTPGENYLFLLRLHETVIANLLNTDFGNVQLAKGMALSTSQLYRKVKGLTGQSPSIYIRGIRLENAKDLLQNSNYIISEIAYKSGFSDPFYFSRTFSKTYGMSPSSYRKSMSHLHQ